MSQYMPQEEPEKPQETPAPLPTNIQYQRLLMTQRVLFTKGQEPTQNIYELLRTIHYSKDELGLKFPDNFNINFPNMKMLEQYFAQNDDETLRELKRKTTAVFTTVTKRIAEINRAIADDPDVTFEKTDLEKNIELLSEALQFNDTQKQLLLFFATAPKGRFDVILKAASYEAVLSHEDYVDALAIVLGSKDKKALKEELEPDSALLGVNFLAHDEENHEYTVDKPLQRILATHYKSSADLLTTMLGPSPTTELTREEYAYMEIDVLDMERTLRGDLKDNNPHGRKNMGIGGPPGTGKTEVTAILAQALKAPAFLVGVAQKSEKNGHSLDEPTRDERIKALVRAAFVVRKTGMNAVLVFDEAEDVLRDLNRKETKETGSKAFINELLETLGVPVVFISNRMDLFDPASVRRILPFYSMNYMPFKARVDSIVKKTKKYIGVDLTAQDVKQLSLLASELSVAAIDSCINVVGKREPDKSDKNAVLEEIEREFKRALKAQNSGILPPPIPAPFDSKKFKTGLISANDNVVDLHTAFAQNPTRLAGKDIAILGHSGTGRESIARFLSTATGGDSRSVTLNARWLAEDPINAHASDLERAALDETPIVFSGALKFLLDSNGHPFIDRVRAHPLPTFFTGDLPDTMTPRDLEKALAHVTFVMRTGNLSPQQLQEACRTLLGFEANREDIRGIKDMSIGSVMTVKRQLEAIGQEGNKKLALERMEAVAHRLHTGNEKITGFASQR